MCKYNVCTLVAPVLQNEKPSPLSFLASSAWISFVASSAWISFVASSAWISFVASSAWMSFLGAFPAQNTKDLYRSQVLRHQYSVYIYISI